MAKRINSKPAATFIDALENPEGRELIDAIEEYISDGEERFAFEINLCIQELFELTGYRYSV